MLLHISGKNALEKFLKEREFKFLFIRATWDIFWYIIPLDIIERDIDSLKKSLESYANELKDAVRIEMMTEYALVSIFNREFEGRYSTEIERIDSIIRDITLQISDWKLLGGVNNESERIQLLNKLKEVKGELNIIWNEVKYFTSDFTDECKKRRNRLRTFESFIRELKTIH